MDKTEAAYIAGFCDGEGSITIIKSKRTDKSRVPKGNTHNYLNPRLYIGANTNRRVLEWCKEKIGAGAIFIKHAEKENRKAFYILVLNKSTVIVSILKELLPFLIVKHKQAELMIEFCEARQSRHQKIIQDCKTGKIVGVIGKPHTQRELDIHKELSNLNKRGIL